MRVEERSNEKKGGMEGKKGVDKSPEMNPVEL